MLLAIPGAAEAGKGREGLPTCGQAEKIAKGKRQEIQDWAARVCLCTGPLKRKVERNIILQSEYDAKCGKDKLSDKPPGARKPRPSTQPDERRPDVQPEDPTKAQQIRKLAKEIRKLMKEKQWDQAEAKANAILQLNQDNKFAKGILDRIAKIREKERQEKIKKLTDEIKKLVEEENWDQVEAKANELLRLDKKNEIAKDALNKIPSNLAWLIILISIFGLAGATEIVLRIGNRKFREAIAKLQEEDNPDLAECIGEEYEPTDPPEEGSKAPLYGTGQMFARNRKQYKQEARKNREYRTRFEATFNKHTKRVPRKR